MAGIIGEAFVRVRPEMRGFRGDVERNARTASRGLGKIIGAGLGVGIGFGIERELGKSIDAAKEAQVVQARLEQAVRSQGIAWAENADHIEEATQALSKLSSFDDEELKASFIGLLRRTGDVNKALQLNALAADVARGANQPLATVAKAIGRAYDGQTAGLSRLGVSVKKGVTGFQALDQVQRKYAGSAQAYAGTAAGAQDRLNKVLNDSREIIGGALLPVITDLSTRFADYIEKQNESGALQRKVNTAVKEGGEVVHTLATAFEGVQRVVSPVIKLVGGLGNALSLAFGVKLAVMLRNATGNFGTLSASVARTTEAGVAEAGTFGRAWDVATRPRNMVVTTTTTGPGPTTTKGGTARGVLGKVGSGIASYGPLVAYSVAIGVLLRDTSGDPRRVGYVANGLPHAGMAIFYRPQGGYFTYGLTDERVDRQTLIASQILKPRAVDAGPHRGVAPLPTTRKGGAAGTPGAGKPADTGTTKGITRLQRLRLDFDAAARAGDLPAERAIQAKIVAIYKYRVDNTKLTGQALVRFKQEYSAELDKYDSIQDQLDADAAQRRDDRQQARDAKRDKADAKLLHRLQRGRSPVNKAIARALGTEGTKDDVITAKALVDRIDKDIALVKANVKNVETRTQTLDSLYDDRDAAVENWQNAKKAHSAHLRQIAADAQAQRTTDLDTILQIAQLTDDPAAIGRALDAVIANDRKLLAKARKSGVGVLDAILKLRTDLKAKRDLLKGGSGGTGTTGTTAYDLLTKSIGQFTGGNLINADMPFAGPSGFVAPLVPFLRRVPGVSYPGSPPGTGTTGGPTPAERSIDRLIAALDRNTASKGGDTASTGTVTAPKIDPRRVTSRYSADGRYYESARARENVGTRGGI